MVHREPLHNYDNENLFSLPDKDPLGVLSSTQPVIELGEQVWINTEQVEALSELWIQQITNDPAINAEPAWNSDYHFFDGTERSVNWLLVLDALNFCFWAEKDQPRWSIDYQGTPLNGYWAEAASLKRAVEEGIPLWDAEYLSTISEETMAHIFRGSQTIPLFEQRVYNAREVGRVLVENFEGQFARAIEQVKGNAVELALLLANNFTSFQDIATYRKQTVRFLKRAQICVADIASAFGGKKWGAIVDLHQLTAFADYKIPQILRYYNVLEYYPALAERIDNRELLEAGSEAEVEIRAATIWACELLRRALQRRGHTLTASEIDQKLWHLSQNLVEMRPYHRTRTMYY